MPSNIGRKLLGFVAWFVLALTLAWAVAALYLDTRIHWLGVSLSVSFLAAVTVILIRIRPRVLAFAACFGLFAFVLAW